MSSTDSIDDPRFRLLFDNSPDAMVIADDDGRYLDINQAAGDLFGYSREQMLTMRVGDLATDQGASATERYQAYLQTGRETGEFGFIRADGEKRIASYTACRLGPGQHMSILRDVTSQKRAEEQLYQSELRFRMLVEQSPLSIQILSPEGYTVQVNRAWEQLWSLTLDNLHDYNMLQDKQLADKGILPYIKRAFAGEATTIPPILYDPEETLPQRTNKPNPQRWTQAFIYPVKDEAGQIREIVLIHEDITERVQHLREIESLNVRLQRSLQETHHRVKNNLQVISALVEVQTLEDASTVPIAAMHRIGHHTRSLAAIHDLLTQQAKGDTPTDAISTRAAMDQLLPLLQATTGGRQIHYQVDDVRLPMRVEASLALVISEIVSNAVKYGAGDIKITLVVENAMVRLEICDEGIGFPEGFDSIAQANTGLALVHSLVAHDLGGTVHFENRPEGGTRVRILFPIGVFASPE